MLVRVISYFLIGGAMLVLARIAAPAPRLSVPDHIGASGNQTQNDWMLLDQAHRLGWGTSDAVVYTHLVRAMRDLGETGSARELFEKALALNLHRHDPIVRERLLDRARRALRSVPEKRMPSRDVLKEYFQANRASFVRVGEVRFAQVFFEDVTNATERVGRLRQALEKGAIAPAELYGHGDSLIGLRSVQSSPPNRLERRYGLAFRETLEACTLGELCGPAHSPFGVHFFYVLEKTPPRVPPFAEIEQKVQTAYLREAEQAIMQERVKRMRERYGL